MGTRGTAMRQPAERTGAEALRASCRNILSNIAGVYVFLMLTAFPVFATDMYFEILDDKFYFFWIGTAVAAGACLLTALICAFVDWREFDSEGIKAFFGAFRPGELKKHLMLPDYFMLLFMAVSILSTICSEWRYEAFWGNMGRYQGLFLWLWYAVAYVLVTRFFRFRRIYLDAYLLIGLFVAGWGVMDYFGLDPFGWQSAIPEYDKAIIFSSSIGNVNTLTAVVGLYLSVACVLFCCEQEHVWETDVCGAASDEYRKNRDTGNAAHSAEKAQHDGRSNAARQRTGQTGKRSAFQGTHVLHLCFYYIAVVICFMAMIAGQSDNALLAVAALLCFLPFFAWRSRQGVLRYLFIVAALFGAMLLIGALSAANVGLIIPEWSWGVLLLLSNQHRALVLCGFAGAVLLSALFAAVCWLSYRRSGAKQGADTFGAYMEQRIAVWPRLVWLLLGVLALIGLIWLFYDANHGGHPEWYAPLSNLFYFNADWGTHRGFNWNLLMKHFQEFPFWKKLIGAGPETYGIFTGKFDYYIMMDTYGETYDSPHNEFLQYLFSTGVLGFIGYYGTVVTACVQMFGGKCSLLAKKCCAHGVGSAAMTAAAGALAFGVITYTVQSFINISAPIVVPTVILFLAMGIAVSKGNNTDGFAGSEG